VAVGDLEEEAVHSAGEALEGAGHLEVEASGEGPAHSVEVPPVTHALVRRDIPARILLASIDRGALEVPGASIPRASAALPPIAEVLIRVARPTCTADIIILPTVTAGMEIIGFTRHGTTGCRSTLRFTTMRLTCTTAPTIRVGLASHA
jgi:hypothetical protein